MTAENKIAKAVGALFVITMLLGMIDAYTVSPLLDASVDNYHAHRQQLFIGAFAILFMALGVVGIAILLYPIVEKYNKLVAIAYLCSRMLEALLLISGVIVYFLVLSLSEEYLAANFAEASYLQTMANLAVVVRYSSYQVAMIILGCASVALCYVFYKTQLIPRSIAALGLVGYGCLLVSAPLDLMGAIDTTEAGGFLYIPGAVFELLLLPYWLIFKGFNASGVQHNATTFQASLQ